MKSNTPIKILLVEDSASDVRLIEEAFASTNRRTNLHVTGNGYDALHYLKREAAAEAKELPDLALVDLKMPGKDGCAVLEAIRDDQDLQSLPVIILTNSDADADVVRCYDARANAYLTKPADFDEFVALVETFERFWCERVQLPSAH